jgi:hypothetical protein
MFQTCAPRSLLCHLFVVSLTFGLLSGSNDGLTNGVLSSLEKILDYLATDYQDLNTDGLFAFRVGQGIVNVNFTCNWHQISRPAVLSPLVYGSDHGCINTNQFFVFLRLIQIPGRIPELHIREARDKIITLWAIVV